MIKFDFADMREKAHWTQAKFDIDDVWKNVDEGLNLGGQCQNDLPNKEKCGAYVVLRMGMLSKSDKTEDVHKLKDVKRAAYSHIQEEILEEQKFFEDL